MTKTTKLGLVGSAVVAVGVGIVATNRPSAPLPRLDLTPGCVQAASVGGAGRDAMAYTGDVALWGYQWGFLAVSATTGGQHSRNGVGKTMPPYCPPQVNIVGDCWSSVTELIATHGSKKWIVAAGGPAMCGGEGLQVWKWNGNTFVWWKRIPNPSHPLKETGADLRLEDDLAWGRTVMGGAGWNIYALEAGGVAWNSGAIPPPFTPQPDIQGYTYRLFPVNPTPLPNPYPGPKVFYALRQGGAPDPTPTKTPAPVVTTTPAPIPTPGSHGQADYIEALANAGVTAGCGPGRFCPDAPITRGQYAVMWWKDRHGSAPPPKCKGLFPVDVPCAQVTPVAFRFIRQPKRISERSDEEIEAEMEEPFQAFLGKLAVRGIRFDSQREMDVARAAHYAGQQAGLIQASKLLSPITNGGGNFYVPDRNGFKFVEVR